MPVVRRSEQSSMTIEEFYLAIAIEEAKVGEAMLQLIEIINSIFKQTVVWGLTSHYRLVLQTIDESCAEWYVIVASSVGYYYFEYLLPASKQPWENAYVRGEAHSLEEARRYLLIAMRESDGWSDNEELQKALSEHQL